MHTKSGLAKQHVDQYFNDALNMAAPEVSDAFLGWATNLGFEHSKTPLSGSTAEFDRAIMLHSLPAVEEFLHYRTINISSVKELCRVHNPRLFHSWKAQEPASKPHRALLDLAFSIREYQFYLDNFLFVED